VPEDELERLFALEVARQPAGAFRERRRGDLERADRWASRCQRTGAELDRTMSVPGTPRTCMPVRRSREEPVCDVRAQATDGAGRCGAGVVAATLGGADGDRGRRWRLAEAEGVGSLPSHAATTSASAASKAWAERRVAWIKRSSGDSGRSGRRRRPGRAPARRGRPSPRPTSRDAHPLRLVARAGAPGGTERRPVSISSRSAGTTATASADALRLPVSPEVDARPGR
jgi:hypothetical protein